MNWLDRLDRKFGKYAIKGLMKYIVIINLAVYMIAVAIPNVSIVGQLALFPDKVMHGEVWRIITFIFIPPGQSLILILFALYLYYMIGTELEQEWGSFKFNVYYFVGVIGAILAAFITDYPATPTYLNLSLFLAFACIYPDYEILLFFILPIKMKYLAIFEGIFLAVTFIQGSMMTKLLVIFSVINFFLFFGKSMLSNIRRKNNIKNRNKKSYTKNIKVKKKFNGEVTRIGTRHRCNVCGMTEKDNPEMDFRYCSTCEGEYEYCMEHLNNHEHIKK